MGSWQLADLVAAGRAQPALYFLSGIAGLFVSHGGTEITENSTRESGSPAAQLPCRTQDAGLRTQGAPKQGRAAPATALAARPRHLKNATTAHHRFALHSSL